MSNNRYIVVHADERPMVQQIGMGRDCWHLVDTASDETIWADGMMPEDAILPRDLNDFVIIMNEHEEERLAFIREISQLKLERNIARNTAKTLRAGLIGAGAIKAIVDGILLSPLLDKDNNLPKWIEDDALGGEEE